MKASIKVLSEIKIDGLRQVELLKDTISVPQCVVILGFDLPLLTERALS